MRAANKASVGDDVDESGRRRNAAQRARRLSEAKADSMPVVLASDGPRAERLVDAPMVQPAPRGGVIEVFQQPYLLRLIVQRQLAAMYAASFLGLLWSYVQPAMRFGVYYLVMGIILKMHAGFPAFAIHLFCGIVFVHYFSETWSGGTRSIWQNRALVLKMRMPREIFPIASMMVALYHTFPQVILLVFCCVITGWQVTWLGLAAGLLGMAILVFFSTGMALLFSALNVFFRDVQNIVQTMLQFMHFLVPMMYPFSRIWEVHAGHPLLYQLYMANPIGEAVILMQRFFWWGVVPASSREGNHLIDPDTGKRTLEFPPDMWTRGLIMLAICMLFAFLAQKYFSRVEGKFPERM